MKIEEFPSEIIEIIAEGDTIIFNFPLSIFNSAAVRLPDKLKFGKKVPLPGFGQRRFKRGKKNEKEWKQTYSMDRKSAGSMSASFLVTLKWTWSPRAVSIRALVPTVPMGSPILTASPAETLTASPREAYLVV